MKLFYYILLVLIVTTSFSCYQKEEGCIDAVAVNFDVTADDNCCCAYPKLAVGMSHVYGDKSLIYGDTFFNDINSPFKILYLQYYLSDFSLIDEDNNAFSTTSTIDLPQLTGDNIETTDDIVLMSRNVFVDSIGFFPFVGSYEKMQFEIGVKEVAKNTNPEEVDADYPLSPQTQSMWDATNNYLSAKIILKPDTSAITTDTFTLNIFENSLVELNGQLELPRGAHFTVNLKSDYAKWFNGINFQNDTEITIKEKIKANLASSLSFL